jgi:hypothetical protein
MFVVNYRLPNGQTGRVHLHAGTASTLSEATTAARGQVPAGAALEDPRILPRDPAHVKVIRGRGRKGAGYVSQLASVLPLTPVF